MVSNSAIDTKFKASIDIGTNTIRCLITGHENNFLSPDYVDMKIIRLGENFKKEGVITQNSINRLKKALKVYSEKIRNFGIKPENVVITGTSVLRDAPNAKDVKNIIFVTGYKAPYSICPYIYRCFKFSIYGRVRNQSILPCNF